MRGTDKEVAALRTCDLGQGDCYCLLADCELQHQWNVGPQLPPERERILELRQEMVKILQEISELESKAASHEFHKSMEQQDEVVRCNHKRWYRNMKPDHLQLSDGWHDYELGRGTR